MRAPVAVILNPSAGAAHGHDDLKQRVEGLFGEAGLEAQVEVAPTSSAVPELARTALERGCRIIVAGGGDGTVSSVAGAIAGTDVVLGVLPLGTLNHFAKDLHISLDIEGAVKDIAAGQMTKVDVGRLNERIFINNSSLGLYPELVKKRAEQQRLGHSKWAAFVWAATTVLRRHRLFTVRLSVDGKESRRRTALVFVGNNEYEVKGLHLGTRVHLDRGRLFIGITRGSGRHGLLRICLNALLGSLGTHQDLELIKAQEVVIETRRQRVEVALDGEVTRMKTPLNYRTWPGALRVMAPPSGQPTA
jgi:diacylglycerol kinase family enzyme